jgi:hypothetical protein
VQRRTRGDPQNPLLRDRRHSRSGCGAACSPHRIATFKHRMQRSRRVPCPICRRVPGAPAAAILSPWSKVALSSGESPGTSSPAASSVRRASRVGRRVHEICHEAVSLLSRAVRPHPTLLQPAPILPAEMHHGISKKTAASDRREEGAWTDHPGLVRDLIRSPTPGIRCLLRPASAEPRSAPEGLRFSQTAGRPTDRRHAISHPGLSGPPKISIRSDQTAAERPRRSALSRVPLFGSER